VLTTVVSTSTKISRGITDTDVFSLVERTVVESLSAENNVIDIISHISKITFYAVFQNATEKMCNRMYVAYCATPTVVKH